MEPPYLDPIVRKIKIDALKKKPYLDDFDDKAERYGEGCEDDQQRDEGDKVGTQARAFLAAAWGDIVMIVIS